MGRADFPPYYISAYGLAVRQGFEGTIDEWLESLHGTPGSSVELRCTEDQVQWRSVAHDGTAGDWQVLYVVSGEGVTRELVTEIIREYVQEHEVVEDAIVEQVIRQIPLSVTEDGYTEIEGLRRVTSLEFIRSGRSITVTVALEGGATEQIAVVMDPDDWPQLVTASGITAPITWKGF